MRVRWVLEDAERPGGVESVTRTLVGGLRDSAEDADVRSWFTEPGPPLSRSPLGWLVGKVRRGAAHSAAARRAGRELRRDLDSSPDLVVVLDPGSLSVAAHLRGAPRWGVHVHWSPDLLLRPWRHLSGEGIPLLLRPFVTLRMRLMGRRNRRILGTAPFLVTLTPSHTRAMTELRPDVVELANPVRLTVSPRPRRLGEPAHVAYLGRLSHEKGPDLFVRAATASCALPDVRWTLAGAGPAEDLLQQMAARAKAPVSFVGWVEDPRSFLETVDVFVLPSRTEAVPLVLAEALAAGCHVVAADAGTGVRDVLDGGRLGRVVPVDDVGGLRAAIADALAERRAGAGPEPAAVRALVRRHDPDRIMRAWVRLFESLAEATTAEGRELPGQRRQRMQLRRRRPARKPY